MTFRLLTIIFISLPALTLGQVNNDGSSAIYKKHFQYGAALHSRGLVLSTKYNVNKTYDVRKQLDIDYVAVMKHFREFTFRQTNSRPFVYGKMNELSILKATYGSQRIIADFINALSVRVNLQYGIGPCFGFVKPVYYIDNDEQTVKFDPQKHSSIFDLQGKARWTEGLSELKIRPGISGKISLSFEWGKQDDRFRAFEAGMMLDVFSGRIPIMAFVDNDFAYLNLYAAFFIGNRW